MLISPSALPISHPVYLLHEQPYLLPHQRHRPSSLTVIPSPPPTPAAGDGRARMEEQKRRQRTRGGAAPAAARVGAAARVKEQRRQQHVEEQHGACSTGGGAWRSSIVRGLERSSVAGFLGWWPAWRAILASYKFADLRPPRPTPGGEAARGTSSSGGAWHLEEQPTAMAPIAAAKTLDPAALTIMPTICVRLEQNKHG
ncbi:hypothetical protein BRADI_1g25913v3 [Brachypodium distachyon]|uniref:Uncharacterized protein n=1 Tax=Brachypodium distachyon TaxID=15368 RepID=A0A0Q3NF18_BRADI|nr:hypothetical protein BRADI_1g25913v3 [Brachypodium distachyon]